MTVHLDADLFDKDLYRIILSQASSICLIAARRDGSHIRVGIEERMLTADGMTYNSARVQVYYHGGDALDYITKEVGKRLIYGWRIKSVEGHPDNVLYAWPEVS